MRIADIFKQYVQHLFLGKRSEARQVVLAAHDRGVSAAKLLTHVIWPAMAQVEKLYRNDRISRVAEHMATRINRTVADQLQVLLVRAPKTGKRMVVMCGEGEQEELGAQIVTDLFEAQGWSVWFVGSGIPDDEVLELVGQLEPDILAVYGAQAAEVPGIRRLISLIREVGVCEDMQVLVSGGVFNRADGLAEEVRADLFAEDIAGVLKAVADNPVRIPKPDVPEPGRRRKRKKTKAQAKSRKAAVVA